MEQTHKPSPDEDSSPDFAREFLRVTRKELRQKLERLARISHHLTVEARDKPAITSLRLLAVALPAAGSAALPQHPIDRRTWKPLGHHAQADVVGNPRARRQSRQPSCHHPAPCPPKRDTTDNVIK